MEKKNYITLTIKTNLWGNLYFNERGLLSTHETDLVGMLETLKKNITQKSVEGFVVNMYHDGLLPQNVDITTLEISLEYKDCDLTIYTQKIHTYSRAYYGLPYRESKQINEALNEIDILNNEIKEYQDQISSIEDEINECENQVSHWKKEIEKLKKEKVK